jgi:hypothetical protein
MIQFAPIRSAHARNMSEQEATARLNEIHSRLHDQSGNDPLKWWERGRLEDEALALTRALEAARRATPATRNRRPEPVELRRVGVDGHGMAIHGAIRTDSRGRPIEVVECRGFPSKRQPRLDAIASQVAAAVTAPIRERLARVEQMVTNAAPALRTEPVEPAFVPPVPYWLKMD